MGDANSSKRGFLTLAKIELNANKMWKIFESRLSNSLALRPFESTIINNFDLDFEAIVDNNVSFANWLRTLMNANWMQIRKA